VNIGQASRRIEQVIYAYAQAPWRLQRQWLGAFLLAVVGMAMVAALYLGVTSQAAIAGRQIQDVSSQMIAVQHASADLQSKLAALTSTSAMESRAAALGYQPVNPADLQYVVVPGYVAPNSSFLVGAGSLRPSAASMPPEYTESLIAWFGERLANQGYLSAGGSR
jgi:hypothetical protein